MHCSRCGCFQRDYDVLSAKFEFMRNYPLLFVIYRENNSLSLTKNSVLVEYFADVALKRSMLFGKISKVR